MGWGPFDLSGKAALVTGGAKGIGFATAARLREAGADVLIADLDESSAAASLELLRSAPGAGSAEMVVADVSDERQVEAMVASCVEHFGKIDVLVNNAGVFPFRSIDSLDTAFVQRVLGINVLGTILATRFAAAAMIARGEGGVIVNVTSRDAFQPFVAGLATYGASKGAILAFTRHTALELAPHRIRACGVAPGAVMTEGAMTGDSANAMTPEFFADLADRTINRLPLGMPATPDEIATVICFLASPAASQITGDTVVADGGMLLL